MKNEKEKVFQSKKIINYPSLFFEEDLGQWPLLFGSGMGRFSVRMYIRPLIWAIQASGVTGWASNLA